VVGDGVAATGRIVIDGDKRDTATTEAVLEDVPQAVDRDDPAGSVCILAHSEALRADELRHIGARRTRSPHTEAGEASRLHV
jgi:hypothetical protein